MRIAKGREIYIITAVVAVVLIVAWYFLLLSPMKAKLSDLDSQVVAQEAALATAKQEVVRLEAYKKTAPQSRAEIVRLGKMLPESEGIPSLIIELTRTADASGVDLNSISRGATQPGVPFGLQTVTLAVTGRFFDVEDFLYRLESYVAFRNAGFRVTGRLLEVTTLSMAGGGAATTSSTSPPLTVSVNLNAYLWAGPAAGAAAAGGTP
jgi:type IV pilus assembly protein PilO